MADIKDFKIGNMPIKPQIGDALRPSVLRTRVTWQKQVTTENASGGPATDSWVPQMDLWSNVQFLLGARLFYAQQESSEAQMWVTIRYRKGVIAGDRFVTEDGLHTYTILTPPRDPSYMHRQLVCTCRELQANET